MFDLAKDGLITMYVESKAKDYINQMTNEPVYKSLNRYSLIFERVCIKQLSKISIIHDSLIFNTFIKTLRKKLTYVEKKTG